MDPEMIRRALMNIRGANPDLATAGSASAPMPAAQPGMDQAYSAPMQGVPQASPPPISSNFNPALEQQAQLQGNTAIDPLIQQIMKHFGLLNFIRNRANTAMVDPSMQG